MATTLHDSTAHSRSEYPQRGVLGSVSSPGCSPHLCSSTNPSRQECGPLTPAIRALLASRVLDVVEIALESHSRTQGATVSLAEGNLAGRKRYAVAIYPQRTIELKNPPTWQQLFVFVIANLDLLSKRGHALGTWFNERKGVHTIDVVVCPSDRDTAIRLALRSQQWAIFDLAAGRDVFVDPSRLNSDREGARV